MIRYSCPCCGYPTLEQPRVWEICRLCGWEDNGQDDLYADQVWGGPNADYSLTEARANFKQHYSMYRDPGNTLHQTEQELKAKWALMRAFDNLKNAPDASKPQQWLQITALEGVLSDTVQARIAGILYP
ncbi:CPCC family cysteine-rich protein [Paenibacillus sp. R14(2021)]|uniref:CPCC family cysteine-rich protein n=1 Tax=Paenibacillus sp. R14(2021) TaxID=2859228 RepID=UPI001C615103|nr:CPCC family cysteine-rich protein [Paenibacillus sp. R14(2021)]